MNGLTSSFVSGNVTIGSVATSTGNTLTVGGNVGITGNLSLSGAMLAITNGNLTVNGNAVGTGGGGGGLTMTNGTAPVTGNITLSGTGAGIMTAVTFNATSDYRIKANVQVLGDNYTVDVLQPVRYNNSMSKKSEIGFIAHEVQQYFPELVTGEKNGSEYQSLNYIGIISILTKEIKDLKQRVTKIENL
jgi:hypothetical protein